MQKMQKFYDINPISFFESMMFFMEEWRSEMVYLLARRLADRVIPPPSPASSAVALMGEKDLLAAEHFLMCFSRVLGILNGMSQNRHFMMSFPVRPWVFMCLVSLLLWAQE